MENKSELQSYKQYTEKLHKSTMFHMSLGSKELFHSNFLHWISIVNWRAFLQIMHGLAGVENFWWEQDIKDDKGNPYYRDEKIDYHNIMVLREHQHFDLSIYILDSEKFAKDNNNEGAEDESSIIIQDTEGNERIQKWIPVLILENKMKSLPYEEQLREYTNKAFEEWRKGEKIKELANNKEKEIEKRGITFILLSLMDDATLSTYVFYNIKELKRPKYTLKLKSEWSHKTYKNLFELISCSEFEGLNKQIIDDYGIFIKALYDLASSCWKVSPENGYRSQIYPWNKDKKNCFKCKIQEIEDYKGLRIHDVREKLLYDQLLSLLEKKLRDQQLCFSRYSKEVVQAQQQQKDPAQIIRIFTNSSYAHGVGIFEAHYILSKDFILNGKKELLKLVIQVQGDRYCHMLIYDNIVNKDKTVNVDVLNKVWHNDEILNNIPVEDTLGGFISINKSKPVFKWMTDCDNDFKYGRYDNNLIYQYVEIPQTAKISEIIDGIVDDVKRIDDWYRKDYSK